MSKDATVREAARRRYWGAAEARIVVEAWRRSGERLASFSRRYGVDRRRVAWWASRLDRGKPAAVRFHPVLLTGGGDSGGTAIEVEMDGGWRLRLPRGFEAEELRQVLAALREWQRC